MLMRVHLSRGCVAAFWAMPSRLTRSFCSKAYRSAACFDLVFSFGHLTDSVSGNDLASIVYICGKCTRSLGYHNFSRIDFVLEYKPCIVITGFFSTVLAINFACSFTINFVKYLATSYNRRKPTYQSWTLINKGHGNISWVWRENYAQRKKEKKNSEVVEDSADKWNKQTKNQNKTTENETTQPTKTNKAKTKNKNKQKKKFKNNNYRCML